MEITLGIFRLLLVCLQLSIGGCSWSVWWNYEGISGPSFWGTMNGNWYMCRKGKNQSPIDIDPGMLLYDPALKHLVIEGDKVGGTLINNGFDLTFEINDSSPLGTANISLGPVSYQYRIAQIKLHFGSYDGMGSEHTVNGKSFDGEMHIVAYNSDVYANLTQAKTGPKGVAVIAAFIQNNNVTHEEFDLLTNLSKLILFNGQRARLKELSLRKLLPSVNNYMTYEGSFTQPGCQETVTWVILNKPIHVGLDQMEALRNLRQRDPAHPQAFMSDNYRPVMPLNRRAIRTNINFAKGCTMEKDMRYQLNSKLEINN